MITTDKPKKSYKEKQSRLAAGKKLTQNIIFILQATWEMGKVATTGNLSLPFFIRQPIWKNVPQLNTWLGTPFDADLIDKLVKISISSPHGFSSYWAAPFLPAIYITDNTARRTIIQESHVGSVNLHSEAYLQWLMRDNQVMANFPAFMNINSPVYKDQRRFLLQYFHTKARSRTATIDAATEDFLQNYTKIYGNKPRSIKEFIFLLILHTTSRMLGLNQCGLDTLYLSQIDYQQAIDDVAFYGIRQPGDPQYEKILFEFFLEVFEANFTELVLESPDSNLLQRIFSSIGVTFPATFDAFLLLPKTQQHKVAMTFVADGIGAAVHSTANSLDLHFLRLLRNSTKLNEIKQQIAKFPNLDLTADGVFEKLGPLSKIGEWVLRSAFINPVFSHESFYNSKPLEVNFPDGTHYSFPKGMLFIVNYAQCNSLNPKLASPELFSQWLSDESTISKFITSPEVATFGGRNRLCPGALTALLEQMIIITQLLSDKYVCELSKTNKLSTHVDRNKLPLLTRVNQGEILFKKIDIDKDFSSKSKQRDPSNVNLTFGVLPMLSIFKPQVDRKWIKDLVIKESLSRVRLE